MAEIDPDPDPIAPPGLPADGITGHGSYATGPRTAATALEPDRPDVAPRIVDQYLMDSERNKGIIAVRQHWIVLIPPAAAVIGGLIAAVTINTWFYWHGGVDPWQKNLLWIAYTAGIAWSAARYAAWRCWWFVITGGRLMQVSGLVRRTVTPLPLKRIRDLELAQTALGRLLGYGTIECESIATDHALHTIEYLPFTVELWVQIWGQLLPATARGARFEGMRDDPW